VTVLVTGAGGMLGTDVCTEVERRGHALVAFPRRSALELTDLVAVRAAIAQHQPDRVINCAAWTDVEGAERTPDAAWRDNTLASWNLAAACAETGAWLVQVSTDFVFDGTKGAPYEEFDATNPLSVYGRSKEAAERLVRTLLPTRHLIVRTAFLYGPHGDNLIEKILRAAQSRPHLTFVEDQVVSPTHTADLARTLLDLVENPLAGTYHAASAGQCSLWELAQAVVSQAGLTTPVHATTFAEFVATAKPLAARPRYSPLACRLLALRGLAPLPNWQDALAYYLERRTLR